MFVTFKNNTKSRLNYEGSPLRAYEVRTQHYFLHMHNGVAYMSYITRHSNLCLSYVHTPL